MLSGVWVSIVTNGQCSMMKCFPLGFFLKIAFIGRLIVEMQTGPQQESSHECCSYVVHASTIRLSGLHVKCKASFTPFPMFYSSCSAAPLLVSLSSSFAVLMQPDTTENVAAARDALTWTNTDRLACLIYLGRSCTCRKHSVFKMQAESSADMARRGGRWALELIWSCLIFGQATSCDSRGTLQ